MTILVILSNALLLYHVSFFPRVQASSKDGKEHLSDDDDLQGLFAGSQVPL